MPTAVAPRQGLQHVGAAPDAAVREDLERAEDVRAQAVQFEEREERGWGVCGGGVLVSWGFCRPLPSSAFLPPPFPFLCEQKKRRVRRSPASQRNGAQKKDENSRIQTPPPVITNHDPLAPHTRPPTARPPRP